MFCTPHVVEDTLHKLEHRVTRDTFLVGLERVEATPAAATTEVREDVVDRPALP